MVWRVVCWFQSTGFKKLKCKLYTHSTPLRLRALLSDDALRRMHVVATTDAVPGDAVVEILVNYARYAGSGSLEEYWIKLMDKLKRSAGYYEHYGIEDPSLGAQQDIATMLVLECLADSVPAVVS